MENLEREPKRRRAKAWFLLVADIILTIFLAVMMVFGSGFAGVYNPGVIAAKAMGTGGQTQQGDASPITDLGPSSEGNKPLQFPDSPSGRKGSTYHPGANDPNGSDDPSDPGDPDDPSDPSDPEDPGDDGDLIPDVDDLLPDVNVQIDGPAKISIDLSIGDDGIDAELDSNLDIGVDIVDDTVNDLVDTVDETVDEVEDVANDAVDEVKDVVNDVKDPVDEVVNQVEEIVDDTNDDVEETVNDVVDTVDNVVGGLLGN